VGGRSTFNLLVPLTSPAGARRQGVAVGDAGAAPRLAEVLRLLGAERALVVHGERVDELPLDGSGVLYDVRPEGIERREIVASDYGLEAAPTSALAGGSAAENARLAEDVLNGEDGPRREAGLLKPASAFGG